MSSGVAVDDACVTVYNEMKMKKQLKFVLFKIQDKKLIVIDSQGDTSKTMDDFKAALPTDQPRYGLVDIEYTTDDGRPQQKLTFVMWSPDDTCSVKDKMLYASSKDAIKKKLVGVMKELQANEMSDLSEENILAVMKK
eukprot:gnl/TRDRNA2_/TRDRNA2_184124_c0_seq1.p1 gnl/TRDRNA2_/TRDRNA2_184124_c0~~gnl/TRDRNA2_/TRDRNA2_184124_c0_seq1.p1  ORF type:complete len:138 (-),score=43.77 gnl/TRDRNA2_/TRDRNA2_184124_c0_seq1:137-550(-)